MTTVGDARAAWERDFPGKSPEHPAWLGFYNIYVKGYESGWLDESGAIRHEKFDAENVTQPEVKERVRRHDGQTSWDAALSLSPTTTKKLYEDIYFLLGIKPMTDEELVEKLMDSGQYSPSGIRSRRHELVDAGWVFTSGTETLSTGRNGRVWKALA